MRNANNTIIIATLAVKHSGYDPNVDNRMKRTVVQSYANSIFARCRPFPFNSV